jgi:hypothetical protein
MGRNAKDVDIFCEVPHSVRNRQGAVVGIYFPTSHRLRLNSGRLAEVDSNGCVMSATGEVGRLDFESYVAEPFFEED